MPTSDVLVIGAGPYGVSVSAHLRGLGIEHRIVGRPMDTWRGHKPAGLCLKSEPYGSVFSAPGRGHDLAAYSKEHNHAYKNRIGPVTLERFLGYADWFTERLVPQVDDVTVTRITPVDGGFSVEFTDSAPVAVRQVVIASGLLPYAKLPAELSGLPSDLVTHSSEHHRLEQFAGRRIAVIGAGQSALETAALAHEAGSDVRIIVRGPEVAWADSIPERLGLVDYIKRPPTKLCEGWRCAFWYTPQAFRRLPEEMRVGKAQSVLGPMGSWWLRDRVDGVIETLTGQTIRQAVTAGNGVRLLLDGSGGQSSMDVDHVIAGTGFRVDLARLSFLSNELRASIGALASFPIVSRAGESSVPGLYFAGAHTAASLGPGMRFIAGTHRIAEVLARSVAHRARTSGNRPLPVLTGAGSPLGATADHSGRA